MNWQILKDQGKVDAKKRELSTEYKDRVNKFGRDVRYVMPALNPTFPKLAESIYNSKYREKFFDTYYYLATSRAHIKELVPASAYYKVALNAIADKQYSLRLSITRVQDLANQIREQHLASRKVMPKTGQPSFNVREQVYQLKSELGNIFFVVRSIMDSVSTLLHFLYGPSAYSFSSFADFAKYIVKDPQTGYVNDEEMKNHVMENCAWFFRLRDIRDYVAHYGSLSISFYEDEGGSFRIYLIDRFELTSLLQSVSSGLMMFLSFCDEHFSNRVDQLNGDS